MCLLAKGGPEAFRSPAKAKLLEVVRDKVRRSDVKYPPTSLREEAIQHNERTQHHTCRPVSGEEYLIDTGESSPRHQQVLIEEQRREERDPEGVRFVKLEDHSKLHQENDSSEMQSGRHEASTAYSQIARNTKKPLRSIEIDILTTV